MASAPTDAGDELFDEFLLARGHDVEHVGWERNHNKLQCPDCGGLHDTTARHCSVCGWQPHG